MSDLMHWSFPCPAWFCLLYNRTRPRCSCGQVSSVFFKALSLESFSCPQLTCARHSDSVHSAITQGRAAATGKCRLSSSKPIHHSPRPEFNNLQSVIQSLPSLKPCKTAQQRLKAASVSLIRKGPVWANEALFITEVISVALIPEKGIRRRFKTLEGTRVQVLV